MPKLKCELFFYFWITICVIPLPDRVPPIPLSIYPLLSAEVLNDRGPVVPTALLITQDDYNEWRSMRPSCINFPLPP